MSHDPAEAEDVRGVEAHKDRARQYRAAMSDLQVAMSDLQVVYDDVIAAGDKVASRWTARGTHDGELQGYRRRAGGS